MLKVGLTGSIAVGKSFVLRTLAQLGCHIIDADDIAREVVMPGSVGLKLVTEAFGEVVLQADGGLDRAKLGARHATTVCSRPKLLGSIWPCLPAEGAVAWSSSS